MIIYIIGQVWPNLAANVLWVPMVWLSHRQILRHIQAHLTRSPDTTPGEQ